MKRFWFLLFICYTCQDSTEDNSCINPDNINPEAVCYEIYQPVCGCNQQTYSNDCYARAAGVRSFTTGSCN
ncbi:MAG: hypothetical protein ACPGC5_07610 [Flavobacteriaceae bacterium]